MESIDPWGNPDRVERSYWASRAFLVFLAFGAMATVLLWSEHRAHLLGALVWAPLLACPLMHLFMHHDHGGHGEHDQNRVDEERR